MIVRKGREPAKDGRAKVICSANMKSQAGWWIRRILSAEAAGDLPIPLHYEAIPVHHIALYPDAAGGGTNQFKMELDACLMYIQEFTISACIRIRSGKEFQTD